MVTSPPRKVVFCAVTVRVKKFRTKTLNANIHSQIFQMILNLRCGASSFGFCTWLNSSKCGKTSLRLEYHFLELQIRALSGFCYGDLIGLEKNAWPLNSCFIQMQEGSQHCMHSDLGVAL